MANKITIFRIVFIPLLILFLSYEGALMSFLALVTFVLLALTDLLDGYVARKTGEVTGMGKLLDPIADKLLVMAVILPLIGRDVIPAWLGVIILGREILVNGLRMMASSENLIISAGKWGKYKTTFYIVGLSILIIGLRPLGLAVLAVGVVLAVFSAAEYFLDYLAGSPPDSPS
jgi:CDP-diacylglycerol--glycerol-3-phosphate 3-phosphatidyltransferase